MANGKIYQYLPGWKGFIELLTNNPTDFSKSEISFLPFIHQPASNYNTIYTTLLCALENATMATMYALLLLISLCMKKPEKSYQPHLKGLNYRRS
jgi:hypothetical protein